MFSARPIRTAGWGLLIAASFWTPLWAQGLASAPPLGAEERAQLRARRTARIQTTTQFMAGERARLQLSAEHSFQAGPSSLDRAGKLHVRQRHYYKGVRVMGSDAIVHLDRSDRIVGTTESLDTGFQIDTDARVSQKEAFQAAAADYASGVEVPAVEGELVITSSPERVHLAWLFTLDGHEPGAMTYLVDAHTGQIIRKWAAEQTASYTPVVSTGKSYFHGTVSFTTGQKQVLDNPFDAPFWILDPSRNLNRVVNMDNKAGGDGNLFSNVSKNWGDGEDFDYETMPSFGVTGQTAGVDAAYVIEKLWDLLFHKWDREGLDDDGYPMIAKVHARKKTNEPYGDAYWSNSAKIAHFGDGTKPESAGRTSTNTVAHEFGHGLWQFALGSPENTGETAGLNEGHGDILGSIVNAYINGKNGKGYELPDSGSLDYYSSRMVDPVSYKDGHGKPYYVENMGLFEEHVQGCAYGHAFVFLATGASSNPASARYSVYLPNGMTGIGIRNAAEIWYLATTGYLSGTPTFSKMRTAYLDAAEDLFGKNSPEYKAVQNAFGGINVGAVAPDTAKPDASLSNPIDNEGERSLFVIASGTDDTGVTKLEVLLNGGMKKTIVGLPDAKFTGFLDIGGLGPGTHTVKVIATDGAGKKDEVSKNFTLAGVNQLIKNGGFESGASNWEESSTGNYANSEAQAFLGARFARFPATGAWIRQKVTIPATANAMTLSYRLRVAGGVFPVPEMLAVHIVSEQNQVLDTVAMHPGQFATDEEFAKDYKYFSYGLPASLVGKTVYLRFLAQMALPGRFQVDNVSLVWSGTVSAKLDVQVDEGEGSVVLHVKDLVNVTPQNLKMVRLVVNGQNIGGDAFEPYLSVIPTSEFVPFANYKVRAEMINWANNKIGQSPEMSFMVRTVDQRVKNGNFENGSFDWAYPGGTKFGMNSGEAQLYLSFLGNRFAYFDGSSAVQTLYQQISIPAGADTATLTYRLRVDPAAVKDSWDTLTVRVVDPLNGQVLKTIHSVNGILDTHDSANWRGHVKFTHSLSEFINRLIRLEFRSVQNGANPTRFVVDCVSVTARTFGVAN